jgi:hypothetical protein
MAPKNTGAVQRRLKSEKSSVRTMLNRIEVVKGK